MLRRTLIAAGALSLLVAPSASANTESLGSTQLATTAESSETCSAPRIENPFTRWSDRRDYVKAPSGSFESASTAGWQLSGGAKRVTDADPVDLGAGDGAGMLALPAGARAISPVMCVDLDYPTFRILTKAVSRGELQVDIVYPDSRQKEWVEVKKFDGYQFITAGSGWKLTDDIDMKPDMGGQRAGLRRAAFRVTALTGTWRMDDLFVDPRRR